MPKNKKRRKVDNLQSLEGFNLTGFDNQGHDESLADCMGELLRAQAPASVEIGSSAEPCRVSKTSLGDDHVDRDKVESWNQSLLAWIQSGNYSPGLLPSIDEELARHFHVQEISKFLLEQGNDLRMPVFERWLLDSRLEGKSKDPIFPLSLQPASSPACHRLLQELIQNGINETRAKDVVAELCRKSNIICQELASKAETYERTSPLKKGDCMDLEDKGSTITLTYSRKKWTKPFHFSMNKSHYENLKGRFFEIHGKSTGSKLDAGSKKIAAAFHVIIVAMMLRYSSVSGGQLLRDLRGGGMQGAIHEQVFDVLQQHWDGPWTEGFASPFNVYLPIFGSAFPPIDWHFGSIGSFLKTDFVRKEGCCCEANPPFSPGVMTKMVDHIDVQLAKADRHGTLLTFVVIVPTVGCDKDGVVHRAAAQSFQRMVHSESCRLHIQLAAREHGYVEGAQHLRATRYKQSSYDTSVIILQSQSSRDQLFDEIEVEKKIQAAFASKHETELIKRKAASGC